MERMYEVVPSTNLNTGVTTYDVIVSASGRHVRSWGARQIAAWDAAVLNGMRA